MELTEREIQKNIRKMMEAVRKLSVAIDKSKGKAALLLLLSITAFAREDWRCTGDQDIERSGNTITSCGNFYNEDRDLSKCAAAMAASYAFNKLYMHSPDITGKAYSITPLRMTCDKVKNSKGVMVWFCATGFRYEIEDGDNKNPIWIHFLTCS